MSRMLHLTFTFMKYSYRDIFFDILMNKKFHIIKFLAIWKAFLHFVGMEGMGGDNFLLKRDLKISQVSRK